MIAPYAYDDGDGSICQIPIKHKIAENGNTIHLGFLTDMRSGGRWVSVVADRIGRGDCGWINHDYRYAYAPGGMTRREADLLLRKDLRTLGFSKARSQLVYIGVRAGGYWAWKNNRVKSNPDEYHYAPIPATVPYVSEPVSLFTSIGRAIGLMAA